VTDSRTRQVLFVCVENACRSLMAEAIFNAHAPSGWAATSAGTRPAPSASRRSGPMLAEIGMRLPVHAPQLVTPELIDGSEGRVTMGCLDDRSCPAQLISTELQDWGLPDPSQLDDEGFRGVRDEIVRRVLGLTREIRESRGPSNPEARSVAR
jgi:arsenate reductase (thioredoxin)